MSLLYAMQSWRPPRSRASKLHCNMLKVDDSVSFYPKGLAASGNIRYLAPPKSWLNLLFMLNSYEHPILYPCSSDIWHTKLLLLVGQHTVAVLCNIVQSWRLGPWIQRNRKDGTTNQAVKLCQKQFSDSPQQGCLKFSLSWAKFRHCRRQKSGRGTGDRRLRVRRRCVAGGGGSRLGGLGETWKAWKKHGWKTSWKVSILEISGAFQRCSSGWWCNNHLEKYEFVNGNDDIQYMKWKIKAMFETTNQSSFVLTEWCLQLWPFTTYNWLFLWDKTHSINGVFLVLITGILGLGICWLGICLVTV